MCSGANMDFDRLRFVSERADSSETLISATIPERPGAFQAGFVEHVVYWFVMTCVYSSVFLLPVGTIFSGSFAFFSRRSASIAYRISRHNVRHSYASTCERPRAQELYSVVSPRNVTEFSYRYHESSRADMMVSFQALDGTTR